MCVGGGSALCECVVVMVGVSIVTLLSCGSNPVPSAPGVTPAGGGGTPSCQDDQ